jgi:hypothetical protein
VSEMHTIVHTKGRVNLQADASCTRRWIGKLEVSTAPRMLAIRGARTLKLQQSMSREFCLTPHILSRILKCVDLSAALFISNFA